MARANRLRLTAPPGGPGDDVAGLIRNPEPVVEVQGAGASPMICDLEQASVGEVAAAIDGSDVLVFAAGAGLGSRAERKVTMDRDGPSSCSGSPRRHQVSDVTSW
jgi:hypothetical protein